MNKVGFTWDESMSTGVPILDSQHKQLIAKFNEFTKIITQENSGTLREEAGEVLDFLQFYASWHFKKEEELMDQYNCPVAEANKAAHKRFLAEFGALYNNWQKGSMDPGSARETHDRLANWIIEHIHHTDTQLSDCIEKSK